MFRLTYVFVHELSGWGSYDKRNRRLPYWGMRGSGMTARLQHEGFDCCATYVSSAGSAWDCACELCVQLVEIVTDSRK